MLDAFVDLDAGQYRGMALSPSWVAVRLLDELGDRTPAIADHMGRNPLGERHHLSADHQDPVVRADEMLLDYNATAVFSRLFEAPADLVFCCQTDVDAASMIAIEWFGDHGVAQPCCRRDCVLRRSH